MLSGIHLPCKHPPAFFQKKCPLTKNPLPPFNQKTPSHNQSGATTQIHLNPIPHTLNNDKQITAKPAPSHYNIKSHTMHVVRPKHNVTEKRNNMKVIMQNSIDTSKFVDVENDRKLPPPPPPPRCLHRILNDASVPQMTMDKLKGELSAEERLTPNLCLHTQQHSNIGNNFHQQVKYTTTLPIEKSKLTLGDNNKT